MKIIINLIFKNWNIWFLKWLLMFKDFFDSARSIGDVSWSCCKNRTTTRVVMRRVALPMSATHPGITVDATASSALILLAEGSMKKRRGEERREEMVGSSETSDGVDESVKLLNNYDYSWIIFLIIRIRQLLGILKQSRTEHIK